VPLEIPFLLFGIELEKKYICSLYDKEKEILLNDIHKDNQNLFNLSDKQKLIWILTNENISILHKVCNFLVTTFETRSQKIVENKRNTSSTD
jgi:hypothetical protein